MNPNLIFDTTFILPLFGIRVNLDENFQDELKTIWKNGIKNYNLYISSISLLETSYKLNREYRKHNDIEILKRYNLILPTITKSKIFKIHSPLLDINATQYFYKFRDIGHEDLLDCWIASSVVALQGIFISQDMTLNKKIQKNKLKLDFEFKMWHWDDLRKLNLLISND